MSAILNEQHFEICSNIKLRHFEIWPIVRYFLKFFNPNLSLNCRFPNMATNAVLLKHVVTNFKFDLALSAILNERQSQICSNLTPPFYNMAAIARTLNET